MRAEHVLSSVCFYDEGIIKNLLKLSLLPVETFTIFFVKMLLQCTMEKKLVRDEEIYDISQIKQPLKFLSLPVETFTIFFRKRGRKCILENE